MGLGLNLSKEEIARINLELELNNKTSFKYQDKDFYIKLIPIHH